MERKFVVIPLGLSGKGKVFKSGDVVTESQLNRPVQDLIKEGFIKELDLDEKEPAKSDDGGDVNVFSEADNSSADSGDNSSDELLDNKNVEHLFTFKSDDGGDVNVFSEADINKKQLMKLMDAKEMQFDGAKSKAILFNQYLESLEK